MRYSIAGKHKEIIKFRTLKTRKATVSVPHDWRNNGSKCTVVNRLLLAIALPDGSLEITLSVAPSQIISKFAQI